METRPKSNDPAIIEAAIREVMPEVVKWLGDEKVPEDQLLRDLTRALRHSHDGYKAARSLDSDGWSPDAELVEILDGYSVSGAHREAEKSWVIANGIVPRHALGAVVSARWGGKTVSGPIYRIEAETAHYVIQHDPAKQGGAYVPFEDVFEDATLPTP